MTDVSAKDLVPFPELAYLLRPHGVKLRSNSLYRMALRGEIPTIVIGKFRFVNKNHVPAIAAFCLTKPKLEKRPKGKPTRPPFESFL